MSTDSRLENDNGSLWTDLPWLRRTLVFLSLGPLLGVFELMAFEAALGGFGQVLSIFMGVVFVAGLVVSVITGIIDGMLAGTLPIAGRVPLIALVCALLVIVPPAALFGPMTLAISMAIGTVAALNMAACALLSHDYRGS
jgi:hypothetical protein